MSDVIKKTSNKVDGILQQNEKDICDEKEAITTLKSSIDEYEKELSDIIKTGDTEKYKAYKAKIEDIQFQVEYHKARLKSLTEEPLISADEYNKMVSDVMLYLRKTSDKAILETVNFLLNERDKAFKLDDEISEANGILKKLQRKIYREDIRKRNKDGSLCYIGTDTTIDTNKILKFNDHDFLNWILHITYYNDNKASSTIIGMQKKVQGR